MARVPNWTCPDINRIQQSIKQASSDIEYYARRMEDASDRKSLESIASNVYDIISSLEDLRSDNSSLRDYGITMKEERDGFETDLDNANNEIESLKAYVKELEDKLEAI